MPFNSTIVLKKRMLKCGHFDFAFSNGMCSQCAKVFNFNKRNPVVSDDEDLQDLINDCDELFSKYVRLSAANEDGIIFCYICGEPYRWQESQNMHYIGRKCMFLRFDTRNCKCGCKDCNQYKSGNLIEYGRKLDIESPGITEILFSEANMVYKYSRDKLRNLRTELTNKVSVLLEYIKTDL